MVTPNSRPRMSFLQALGTVSIALPILCFVVLIWSTGVVVQAGAQRLFYESLFFILKAGIVLIPLGALLCIFGGKK